MSKTTKLKARSTRWIYFLGGLPVGVIQNGIAFFLLLFYNQVLGLDPVMASLALALALVADAITDPLIGFISDNWVSRWGRRLPFLLFAIIPTSLMYYLIWNPPSFANDAMLFWYLLITTILLRTSLTIFDVPHNALNAELTTDYHERTNLANYKVAGIQIAGYIMVLAMYLIWLLPTEAEPSGILNKSGYEAASTTGAIVVFVTMLLATLTLGNREKNQKKLLHYSTKSPNVFFQQLTGALKVRSFRALLVSGILSAIATGLFFAMWAYVMNYFWALSSDETSYVLLANFAGAIFGTISGPFILTRGNKKNSAIFLTLIFLLFSATPYLLRFFDFFPVNGTNQLLVLLALHGVLQVMLSVWLIVVVASMTTDIVEAGKLQAGFESQGLIMAATTFIQKAGTAGGLVLSGLILGAINFPQQALAQDVPPHIIKGLGLYFVMVTSALYLISLIFLLGYKIDQQSHEATLEAISDGISK